MLSNCTSFNSRITLYLIKFRAGRCVRGRTRSPNATFSNTVMWRNRA